MHDIPGVSVTLLAILAGILFNRHDVSELRKEMLERFALVDKRFEQVDKRFEQIDRRFDKIDARLDTIDGRIIDLNRAIGHIEGRAEAMKK